MNERIKSLLAKAHLEVMEEFGIIDTNRVAEKFAELIVRECADWIKNTDSDPDIGEEDAKALLEHFGVKE